jgi:hypothetical protein
MSILPTNIDHARGRAFALGISPRRAESASPHLHLAADIAISPSSPAASILVPLARKVGRCGRETARSSLAQLVASDARLVDHRRRFRLRQKAAVRRSPSDEPCLQGRLAADPSPACGQRTTRGWSDRVPE